MKTTISYEQALEIVKIPSDKMKIFIFVRNDCPICNSFVPDIVIPEIENNLNDIEYYIIDTTVSKMTFPPLSYPSFYYFVPNSKEEMPITRSGEAPAEVFRFDLSRILRLKQGISIIEAFSESI